MLHKNNKGNKKFDQLLRFASKYFYVFFMYKRFFAEYFILPKHFVAISVFVNTFYLHFCYILFYCIMVVLRLVNIKYILLIEFEYNILKKKLLSIDVLTATMQKL